MKKKLIFLFCNLLSALFLFSQQQTLLTGHILHSSRDTLKLVLQLDDITRQSETKYLPLHDSKFEQELNVEKPVYLYLSDGINFVNGLIEPGDQVTINYDAANATRSLQFTGKGSEKFNFLTGFYKFQLYKKLKERIPLAKTTQYPFDHLLRFIDSTGNAFLGQLSVIKPALSRQSFDLLKADVMAAMFSNKYSSIGMVYHEDMDQTLANRKAELTDYSKKTIQSFLQLDNNLAYSSAYVNTVYNILFKHYDNMVLTGKTDNNLLKKYAYLGQMLPGGLKTPVLTLFLEHDISKMNQAEHLEAIISKTYVSQKDSLYHQYILKQYADATSFKKGMAAPDFTLENEKGEKVNLATFRGKVIYLDFWYAACGPCHALFNTIKPVKQYFSGNPDVIFLCVSIDPKDAWLASLKKFSIEGYHAFTEGKEATHSIIKNYKVGSYPTTCLIDAEGQIFMANPSTNPDELKQQIEVAVKEGKK